MKKRMPFAFLAVLGLTVSYAHASSYEVFQCDSLDLHSEQHLVGSSTQVRVIGGRTLEGVTSNADIYHRPVYPNAEYRRSQSLSELSDSSGAISKRYGGSLDGSQTEFTRIRNIGVLSYKSTGMDGGTRTSSFVCKKTNE